MHAVIQIDERSRRVARIAAAFVFFIALLAAAAVVLRLAFLSTVFPGYPALTTAAAIGILGLATGLWGVARGSGGWALAGAAVAVIAGSLGDLAGRATSVAGALSFALSGIGIVAIAARRRIRAGTIIAGVVGMLSGVFCAALLFTYTTDVLSGLRANHLTSMAIPTAAAQVAVGVALAALAWRRRGDYSSGPFPPWFPWAAGGAVLATTVLLWRALAADEGHRSSAWLRTQADIAHYELLSQLQASAQLVRQFGAGTADSTKAAGVPALEAIGWIDAGLTVRRVLELGPGGAPGPRELGRMVQNTGIVVGQAVSPDRPTVRVADDQQGRAWVLLATSECRDEGCRFPVVGVIDPGMLVHPAMSIAVPGYDVAVRADGRLLYQSSDGGKDLRDQWVGRVEGEMFGSRWEVEIWPKPATAPLLRSDLPAVVGGLGLMVSILLTATLRLVQTGFTAARRAERARLALALETATDGLWDIDLVTGESNRSRAVWERLGYDPATVAPDTTAQQWGNLIHPDDRLRVRQRLEEYVTGRAPDFEIEYRIQARDGTWHWIVERGRVVERDVRGRAMRVLGICADVTERKRADQALADSERRFRVVFDSGFQFESVLDLDGRLLESNLTSLEFARVDLAQVRGTYFWDTPWWSGSAASRLRLKQACVEAAGGKTVTYQDEVVGADDQRALIDFSLKPIRDAEGRVAQILAEGRDITERRRAEDAMREMDTLSTMGRVAARVAHEINNPLAGIENAFLLVKDAVPPSHPYYSYVGAIEREIGRIATVTRQLYETYRPASEGMNDASVPLVISDAVKMLEQLNRNSQVKIEVDASGVHGVLPVPSALLRQAVYNLVQNAVEASPAGGTVSVRAWTEGPVFWLSIRDHGPGIPEEMRERIFEPFVTTKRDLKTAGMGLGLSLVRRSVQALGGRIEIHDPEDGGSEFRIRLTLDHQASRNGS